METADDRVRWASRCRGCAWPADGGPRRDRPARPIAALGSAGRRWRSSGHRWGRSCSTARWRAPGSARPRWPGRRGPLRREPPVAGPADSRDLRRTRWPRCASRRLSPGRAAWSTWRLVARTLTLGAALVSVDGHRGVRCLVGVDADHHIHDYLLVVVGTTGALLLWTRARSSFEPLRGEVQTGELFVRKPTGQAGGRHFESYPARTSKRYGSTATPARSLKQALRGWPRGRWVPEGIDTWQGSEK